MSLVIPLQAVPNQITRVLIGTLDCTIAVYQKEQGLFVDILSDGVYIIAGVLARDGVSLIARDYVGFPGKLAFIDTQGADDPYYDGLGVRWQLVYIP